MATFEFTRTLNKMMDRVKDRKALKREKKDIKDKKADKKEKPVAEDEILDKKCEPYVCTGNLFIDFEEICQRSAINVIPEVVQRTKWPTPPTPQTNAQASDKIEKSKTPQKIQADVDMEGVEPTDENGDGRPKTFFIKEGYNYFKPKVQVELEVKDRPESVSEVYIRGWKVDDRYLQILKKCWVSMERLTFLNFWNAGLDKDSLALLSTILPRCVHVKKLYIDANFIKNSDYGLLLQEDSLIQFLSLRHCQITDQSLQNITHAISRADNCKLISLNLTGNLITDFGAQDIAHVLRKNRSLLDIGLSSNQIGDIGATALASILCKFKLNNSEIYERRKFIVEKHLEDLKFNTLKDEGALNTPRGKSELRDNANVGLRPLLLEKKDKKDKAKAKKDVKSVKDPSTVKEDEKVQKVKKEKEKDEKNVVSAAAREGAKLARGALMKSLEKTNIEPITVLEYPHPTLGRVEYHNILKELWVSGNKMLKSLDLSHNKITMLGVRNILECVKKQLTEVNVNSRPYQGLLSLRIKKNLVPSNQPLLIELNEIMATRDPVKKDEETT